MPRFLTKIAELFLAETSRGTLDQYIAEEEEGGSRSLMKRLGIGTLFHKVGRLGGKMLTPKAKARIQDTLINTFRIEVNLQSGGELESLYTRALERLSADHGDDSIGDYLEFGVYQGNSLVCLHKATVATGHESMRLFGFDSFEGLPESAEEEGVWSSGQYRIDIDFTRDLIERAGVDLGRTFLVKGFFDQTLTQELIDEHEIRKASIIMVDCDLYSSAKESLDFCADLITDAAVILFDDWNSTDETAGEKLAYSEFLAEHPEFTSEEFGGYHGNSNGFLVTRQTAS